MPIVSIEGQSQSYPVKIGDVLWNSLKDQGLELPHGCLSGSCGACRVEIIKGIELLDTPSYIEKDTLSAIKQEQNLSGVLRLSCRAKAIAEGSITLRII